MTLLQHVCYCSFLSCFFRVSLCTQLLLGKKERLTCDQKYLREFQSHLLQVCSYSQQKELCTHLPYHFWVCKEPLGLVGMLHGIIYHKTAKHKQQRAQILNADILHKLVFRVFPNFILLTRLQGRFASSKISFCRQL